MEDILGIQSLVPTEDQILILNSKLTAIDVASLRSFLDRKYIYIKLVNCNLTERELQYLNTLLLAQTNFIGIVIDNCIISDKGLAIILPGLMQQKNLQSLFLSRIGLTQKSNIVLSNILEKKTIKYLDLHDNYLGEDGCRILVERFRQDTSLVFLDLSSNHITKCADSDRPVSTAVTALATALIDNTTIQYVKLANNNLTLACITELANMLANNKSITHLDISKNEIGITDLKILASAIENNSTLLELLYDKPQTRLHRLANEVSLIHERLRQNSEQQNFIPNGNSEDYVKQDAVKRSAVADNSIFSHKRVRMGKNPQPDTSNGASYNGTKPNKPL